MLSAILLGLIWPGIVQQFQVKPSEADREDAYISKNIEATRAAYDLGKVETTPYTDDTSVATGELQQLDAQTASVPLVDPQLVRQTFEQNQQARSYYSVAEVLDVDRYQIEGTDRALVLGVRELNQSGINSSDRNWSNLHTVYTHGNGVIAAYANQRPADDSSSGPASSGPRVSHAGRAGGAARAREVRDAGLLRRAEPRLLDRRQDAGGSGRGAQPQGHRLDG